MRRVPKPPPAEQVRFEGEEVGHVLGMAAILTATGQASIAPSAAIALAARYYIQFRLLLEENGAGVTDVVEGKRYRVIYSPGRPAKRDDPSLVVDISPNPSTMIGADD